MESEALAGTEKFPKPRAHRRIEPGTLSKRGWCSTVFFFQSLAARHASKLSWSCPWALLLHEKVEKNQDSAMNTLVLLQGSLASFWTVESFWTHVIKKKCSMSRFTSHLPQGKSRAWRSLLDLDRRCQTLSFSCPFDVVGEQGSPGFDSK